MVTLVLLAVLNVLLAAAPQASIAPVVAVFDIEDRGAGLSKGSLDNLTEVLSARLIASGKFRLIPRDEIRKQLLEQKAESFKACYAESCQIEVGKAVAAEHALASRIVRLGDECHVTLRLYELREETSGRAATAEGACSEKEVLTSLKVATSRLTGVTRQSMKIRFDPVMIDDVTGAERPGGVTAKVGSLDFDNVDVDALAFYEAAVQADRDAEVEPAKKIARWMAVVENAPQFERQARDRIVAWKAYQNGPLSSEDAYVKKREIDWKKLSRLLRMTVVPEKDKEQWALAFVTAYGRSNSKNPYTTDPTLLQYLGRAEWAAVQEQIESERDPRVKLRLVQDFLKLYPRHAEARKLRTSVRPVFRPK